MQCIILQFDGKVDWDVDLLGIDAFYVKKEEKGHFEEEVRKWEGLVGKWYVQKGVPPGPRVMRLMKRR